MNGILQKLIDNATSRLEKESIESPRIDNIIIGKSYYTMKDSDKVYTDMNLCLVLLEDGYGFSYYQGVLDFDVASIINKRISEVIDMEMPSAMKVALVDALYGYLNKDLNINYRYLKGNLREKALKRAEELIDNIPKRSKILLIGAVSEIAETCVSRDLDLTITDLEPSKIGLKIGAIVEDGKFTFDKLKNVEYAIVSGMVFETDTADEILKIAKEHNVKLIFFMETGSNFGQELIRYGAFRVLSEYFPFYDFNCDTKYAIFEK